MSDDKRTDDKRTDSGIVVRPLYTADDLAGWDARRTIVVR